MHLNLKSIDENNSYYVYAYISKSTGLPYYIGKGKGYRYIQLHGRTRVPKDRTKIVFLEKRLTNIGALAIERRMIEWYGRIDIGTGILRNMTSGGDDGKTNKPAWNRGIPHLDITKRKISIKLRGRKLSQLTKDKIRLARIGSTLSESTRKKISENHADVSGTNNPMFGKKHKLETIQKIKDNLPDTAGENNPMFGKTHSDATKSFLSEHGKNKWTPELKQKLKESKSKGNYITPWGNFISLKEAVACINAKYKDPGTVKLKIVNNIPGYSFLPK